MGAPELFHLDQQLFGAAAPGVKADVANLSGDYTYLTDGYYLSLDAEQAGLNVLPTTAEALDAYVVGSTMVTASMICKPTPQTRASYMVMATTKAP